MTDAKPFLSRRMLSALEAGPLTIKEMALKCGIDEKRSGKSLCELESRGCVVRVPAQYVITEAGHALMERWAPEAVAKRRERNAERKRAAAREQARKDREAKRAAAPIVSKVDRSVCPTVEGASITKSAIRSMHPILSAWAQPVGEAA